jgi:hypothetical protein
MMNSLEAALPYNNRDIVINIPLQTAAVSFICWYLLKYHKYYPNIMYRFINPPGAAVLTNLDKRPPRLINLLKIRFKFLTCLQIKLTN